MTKELTKTLTAQLEVNGYGLEILDCLSQHLERKFQLLAEDAPRHGWLQSCRKNNVTDEELEKIWLRHSRRKGLCAVASRLPKIMTDVARDAETTEETCPMCNGIGRIEDLEETFPACEKCKGTGRLYTKGDQGAQRLIFETMGLVGKQAPLINVGHVGDNFRLEALVSDATKILRGEVIDAEVVK